MYHYISAIKGMNKKFEDFVGKWYSSNISSIFRVMVDVL